MIEDGLEENEMEEEYEDDPLTDCDPFDAPEAPDAWLRPDIRSL